MITDDAIYDALLTQVTGYPSAFWELHHNRGHHAHYLRPERDPARITDRKTGRTMSRGWYAVRGNVTVPFYSAQIAIEERRRGRPAMLRKLAFELGLQIAITTCQARTCTTRAFLCWEADSMPSTSRSAITRRTMRSPLFIGPFCPCAREPSRLASPQRVSERTRGRASA